MRKLLYGLILLLLFFTPVERLDVAKLEPVQTVAVYVDDGVVVIETDTDNKGQGETVEVALQNLEDTTPGVIYLDTAEYLLVAENAEQSVAGLEKCLSPSVRVSMWDGKGSVKSAAEYLSVQADLPKLKDWIKTDVEKR